MDLKKFGEYFAFVRKQEGYKSQRDLADKSGISNATISRIESGSNRVTPEVLRDLADCFNHVTYEQLMMSAGYLNLETVVDEISVSYFKRKLASQYDEVVEETKFCKFYTRGKKLKETLGKRNILIQSIADNLNFSMIDMNDILNENLKIDIQDAIKISKFYRLTFSEYFRIQIDFVITNDRTDEESLLYKIESLINKEIEEI
jgi:transcriptional regulator with XRE-family HTH domain